ncbi:MAG: ABC-F family ATP-binding cassette domain-containing protein [Sphaerochaetaceae bacterium]|nr:ABC-F family ATP-binding cassette domain-containing protein [Sphaerochaetaceae bacterium]
MNILSVENLSLTLNDEPLFENISFGLDKYDRVGLIGNNGQGKSTLLKVLSKKIEKDEGLISTMNETEIGFLEQIVTYDENDTVLDFFYSSEGSRFKLLKDYYKLLEDPIANENKIAQITLLLDKDNIWGLENEFSSILGELGLYDINDKLMKTLSGGMRKKVAIARVLCNKPDILFLDEPTNHLDIKTIEWLQRYLAASTMTIIVVTHDRYFLNAVCNKIIELYNSQIFVHPGNYNEYLERKAKRLIDERKYQDRLSTILKRELEWLKRGPQARTSKDGNRIDRIKDMQCEQRNVGEKEQNNFSSNTRYIGKKILDVKNISKSFKDNLIFKDFTFSFTKDMRIGIIGENGSGKSTLLDVLTNHIESDSGIVDIGVNTVFGYYDQIGRNLTSNKTVLEYVEDISDRIVLSKKNEVSAARFLELFNFPTKLHRLPISTLSGGQRRRLYLLSQLMKNPNFLILDEPTNDLDVETIENLEKYIEDFFGCSIIVSHDRAFLDRTCDYLLIIKDHQITQFAGNYTQYSSSQLIEEKTAKPKENNNYTKGNKKKKKGLTFKEKKELENLPDKIEDTENLINELEESFNTIESTHLGTLEERTKLYEQKKEELEVLETTWLELLEKEEA